MIKEILEYYFLSNAENSLKNIAKNNKLFKLGIAS